MDGGRRPVARGRMQGWGGATSSIILRLSSSVARLEPWLILGLSPFVVFPRPGLTPWLLAVVPLLWLCRWLARGHLTVRTPLDRPLLILMAMLPVSLWATFDLRGSFPKLCGIFLGIALFYALVNNVRAERTAWRVTALLLVGGVAVAGLGLVGTRWSIGKVPGLAPLLTPLQQRFSLLLSGVPRAEEGFNANQVGGTLTLFVPLAASLLLHQLRHPRRAADWALPTLGLAGALGLIVLVLLLTQSRMAYFAVTLALLLLGVFRGGWFRLLALVGLALGVGLVVYFGPAHVAEAMFGFRVAETTSGPVSWAGRVEIWQRALRVIRDHPLTGIGFDTLFPVIHARYPTFLMQPGRDATHAHNVFLQVALDLGLPGLAAFLWLLISLGRMLWQVWRGPAPAAQRALALGLLAGLLAQMIFGLADAIALGQKPGLFLWAFFGLGAALWCMWIGKTERGEEQPPVVRLTSFFHRLLTVHYRNLVLILMLTVALGWGYRYLGRAHTWMALIQSDLAAMESLAREGPEAIAPRKPPELLHQARSDLHGLQSEFAFPLALASHLGWVPVYGPDLEAIPALLEMGLVLTDAGEQALQPLAPLISGQPEGTPAAADTPEEMVNTLDAAAPRLMASLAALEEAREIRRGIRTEHLSPRLAGWVAQLDRALPLLENGLRGALALPELLGASRPRTYLILIQNDDELRPTGGFISGVARVKVYRGRVVELLFEDSYAVDDFSRPYPDPPAPLYEIMASELWVFRDSNWSPDFPIAAEQALELYRLRYDDVEIDGLFALDQQAVQLLVAALGTLEVEEYPQPVSGENVVEAVRASWAPASDEGLTEEWWRQRKDFIGRLLSAAVSKIQDEPAEVRLVGLAWAALQALEERHLFVYLRDPGPAGQMLQETGWDGALRSTSGDYLAVVDANLGFNKVNPFITESLSYTVDLRDPARPRAALTVGHRHRGPETGAPCNHEPRYDLTYGQLMQRCYWDYVRVYVPPGSRLLEATSHPVPGELLLNGRDRAGKAEILSNAEGNEVGKAVFASFLVLSPGERMETRFVYDLPPEVLEEATDSHCYSLYVQKQGGTGAHETRVALLLPSGADVITASPSPTVQEGDTLVYELGLRADLELAVHLRMP